MRLNNRANVSKICIWSYCLDSFNKTFLCNFNKPLCMWGRSPYKKHSARITKPSIFYHCYINIKDITIFENFFVVGNTMTDDLID